MSKNVSELCALLVNEVCGALSCQIITILLQHGRLPLDVIQQYSSLPRNEVKATLGALIQQNLIQQSASSDKDASSYEAHVANIYSLTRLGKYVRMAEGRMGKFAGDVVTSLQELGFAKVHSIIDSVQGAWQEPVPVTDSQKAPKRPLVNGAGTTATETAPGSSLEKNSVELTKAIRALLHFGLIERLRDRRQLFTITDLRSEADHYLKRAGQKREVLGGKAKLEYEEKVMNQMQDWRTEYSQPSARELGHKSEDVELHSIENPPKRRKINNIKGSGKVNGTRSYRIVDDSDDENEDPQSLSEDLTLRMANDKWNVLLRSEQLVQASARALSEPTSKVYEALLHCIEDRVDRCHDEYEDDAGRKQTKVSFSVKSSQVAALLPISVDLKSSLGPKYKSETIKTEAGSVDTPTNGTTRINNDARHRRLEVEQHLQVLAEHPLGFVSHLPSPEPSIPNMWTVDFSKVTKMLIQESLEGIITARFGIYAKRVVRILLSQGKLDERRLSQVSFLRPKDLRAILTAMQVAGFVSTQEVPKDSTRQPRSTIFLWFYDAQRAREVVLEDTYKAMARLLQRAKVEREAVRPILEKVTRSDVQGHEELYLGTAEQEALAEWQRKEEMLLVQLNRQDDLVALMRDFLPTWTLQ